MNHRFMASFAHLVKKFYPKPVVSLDHFRPGDAIDVHFKQEGSARPGSFAGTCIWIRRKDHLSSFCVVKKSSAQVQVIRTFMFYAPSLVSVNIVKKAKKYRRAKLFHLVQNS